MRRSSRVRYVLCVGLACLALLFAANVATRAEPVDASAMLNRADSIRTSDPAQFAEILRRLEQPGQALSPAQADHLRYLRAWHVAYQGDYKSAIAELERVFEDSDVLELRFRASVTLVEVLAIASRHEEAFRRLTQLLELLPRIADPGTQALGLQAAAQLYLLAGQFELAEEVAEKLLHDHPSGRPSCIARRLQLEALYRSGKIRTASDFEAGIASCVGLGEILWANLIRTYAARFLLERNLFVEATGLLEANYRDVSDGRYRSLVSEFDALLGEAHLQGGNLGQARTHALRAIDGSVKNEITVPLVDAYRVLYQVAKRQGQNSAALVYHERFAAADKGYLTEASAKAMAFQSVLQQVAEKKQQIDTLSKRNEVLQLQRAVDMSEAERRGLAALLLLVVVVFFALFAWKVKRSQLHFMKLARRDGLTGIFNRSHFADAAESILAYCKKGEREACVVLIDLDDFKQVNDRHGHAAGDAVLKRAVQACQAHLRSIDIMGRLGGEEFGIVLPDCDPKHGRELAEQFRLAVADISSPQTGVGFPVSASFGVTSSRWSSYNLRQLIIHADQALYAAKNNGRNRVEMFDGIEDASGEGTSPQSVSFDRRRE